MANLWLKHIAAI